MKRNNPIRVTVIQPSLAKYRIPVFRELSRRPGIELRVIYGVNPGVPNVPPDGFEANPSSRWHRRILGNLVMYQPAEWKYCSRKYSDVVILRWSPRSISLFPALLRARAQGVATILWGHGYSKTDRPWWRLLRNWLAAKATATLFYEPRTRERYIEEGWAPDRLFVAINSLDHQCIDEARQLWLDRDEALVRFRRDQDLDEGPVILFVSRLHPGNRLEWLVEAMSLLVSEFPRLKTVIIGNGASEQERLKTLAKRLGLSDNIKFEDGIYEESRLAPWFLSADVIGYPANIGLSLIHAFWYGVPVVASDRDDLQGPEVIALNSGVNGLCYQHGNVSSFAESIRTILVDKKLRDSMSNAARQTVENRFTVPLMVDGMEASIRFAYEQAVGSRIRSHAKESFETVNDIASPQTS